MEVAGVFRQRDLGLSFLGNILWTEENIVPLILFTNLQTYSFFYHLQELFLQ